LGPVKRREFPRLYTPAHLKLLPAQASAAGEYENDCVIADGVIDQIVLNPVQESVVCLIGSVEEQHWNPGLAQPPQALTQRLGRDLSGLVLGWSSYPSYRHFAQLVAELVNQGV
jgi:hypothetical protein